MRRFAAFAVRVVIAAAFAVPALCRADPPPWTGPWRGEAPVRQGGGAVAVAYAGAAASVPVARGLPYGFNRGTCDSRMIAHADGLGLSGGDEIGITDTGIEPGDRDCLAAALDRLPDGRMITWSGADGSTRRLVTIKSYRVDEIWCRDIDASHVFGGGGREITTVCRRPEGRWEMSSLTAH